MNDKALDEQWLCEVNGIADRIITMRALLKKELESLVLGRFAQESVT